MLNPRELEILNILWSTDQPMSSVDIMRERRLSESTVMTVLRKLLNSELVKVVGTAYSGNVLCRTYRPTMASREVVLYQVLEFQESVKNIVNTDDIMSAMIEKAAKEERAENENNI